MVAKGGCQGDGQDREEGQKKGSSSSEYGLSPPSRGGATLEIFVFRADTLPFCVADEASSMDPNRAFIAPGARDQGKVDRFEARLVYLECVVNKRSSMMLQ